MAEFKTAEQYVVDRLVTTERELDNAKIEHSMETGKLMSRVEKLEEELNGAYELLNMLRNFISVRKDSYFGNIISLDNIYEKEHPEIVARVMEYYDMRTEDENDE